MLSAAPPLASPSTLVRIIEDKFTAVSNSLATLTAICPVKESATKIVSAGFVISLTCLISDIMGRSICVRPAVSKIITSEPLRLAALSARLVISSGCCFSIIGKFCIPLLSANNFNCSWAAGR